MPLPPPAGALGVFGVFGVLLFGVGVFGVFVFGVFFFFGGGVVVVLANVVPSLIALSARFN